MHNKINTPGLISLKAWLDPITGTPYIEDYFLQKQRSLFVRINGHNKWRCDIQIPDMWTCCRVFRYLPITVLYDKNAPNLYFAVKDMEVFITDVKGYVETVKYKIGQNTKLAIEMYIKNITIWEDSTEDLYNDM